MKFRKVNEIPGPICKRHKLRKMSKNEKRLVLFINKNTAKAEIIDWENEFISARSMYESLHKSLSYYTHIPVRVIYRKNENKVYLIRTDMEDETTERES